MPTLAFLSKSRMLDSYLHVTEPAGADGVTVFRRTRPGISRPGSRVGWGRVRSLFHTNEQRVRSIQTSGPLLRDPAGKRPRTDGLLAVKDISNTPMVSQIDPPQPIKGRGHGPEID